MKQATVVVGLGFGDEGKGTCVDAAVRQMNADLVVRFNGGPQAAHNVVTDDGRYHAFSQFGSGTFAGARTYLSAHMLIDPEALEREALGLTFRGFADDPYKQVIVGWGCLIVTPWHKLANRLRERARGVNRHGSVGFGVGEARGDALEGMFPLRVRDIRNGSARQQLSLLREYKLDQMRPLAPADPELYAKMSQLRVYEVLESYRCLDHYDRADWDSVHPRYERVVFEGAQGVLLDETHGFAPHNSWTDCTFNNANSLIEEAGCNDVKRIGVLRTYATRHGNGPFPTENTGLDVDEPHNGTHPWMGSFRVGCFDAVLANYALDCCGRKQVDGLALTHLDRIPSGMIALGRRNDSLLGSPLYSMVATEPSVFSDAVAQALDKPVLIRSYGPCAKDKQMGVLGAPV